MKKNKILLETPELNRLILQHDDEYIKKLEDENIEYTKNLINLNKTQKRLREPRINEIKNKFIKLKDSIEILKNMTSNMKSNTSIDFEDVSIINSFERNLIEINKIFKSLDRDILDSDFENFAGATKLNNIRITRFGEMKSNYIDNGFYRINDTILKLIKSLNSARLKFDQSNVVDKIIKSLDSQLIPLLDEIIIFFNKWFSVEGRIYDNKIYENITSPENSHQDNLEKHINSLSSSINLFNKVVSRGLNQDPKAILSSIIENLKNLIESAAAAKKLYQYKSTILLSFMMIKTLLKKRIKQSLIQNFNRVTAEKNMLPAVKDIFNYLTDSMKTN